MVQDYRVCHPKLTDKRKFKKKKLLKTKTKYNIQIINFCEDL